MGVVWVGRKVTVPPLCGSKISKWLDEKLDFAGNAASVVFRVDLFIGLLMRKNIKYANKRETRLHLCKQNKQINNTGTHEQSSQPKGHAV